MTSYPVGKKFACRVDNINPGHIIGRSVNESREEAEEQALRSADRQLAIARSQIDLRASIHEMKSFQSERKSNVNES